MQHHQQGAGDEEQLELQGVVGERACRGGRARPVPATGFACTGDQRGRARPAGAPASAARPASVRAAQRAPGHQSRPGRRALTQAVAASTRDGPMPDRPAGPSSGGGGAQREPFGARSRSPPRRRRTPPPAAAGPAPARSCRRAAGRSPRPPAAGRHARRPTADPGSGAVHRVHRLPRRAGERPKPRGRPTRPFEYEVGKEKIREYACGGGRGQPGLLRPRAGQGGRLSRRPGAADVRRRLLVRAPVGPRPARPRGRASTSR